MLIAALSARRPDLRDHLRVVAYRAIAVSVAFAAMTERRAQREPVSPGEALAELRRSSGSQFDPRVVEALAVDIAEEATPVAMPARA